ncbi:MAG: YraN family protein [Planctomycetaceae bacterium]|jgi:putative endonuclease|nr:YraN family protein [Planctomycetaceae bacterium]
MYFLSAYLKRCCRCVLSVLDNMAGKLIAKRIGLIHFQQYYCRHHRISVSMNPKDVLGRAGEETAVRFLEEKGYCILHRNVRFKEGELDIIARNGTTLIVAEVKTRKYTSPKKPYEYVTWKKRRRILKLTEKYIAASVTCAVRYDILSVTCTKNDTLEVEHLQNAFTDKMFTDNTFAKKKKRPNWRNKKNVCVITD